MNPLRRRLLQASVAGVALKTLPALAALISTPRQTVGPFYPRQLPLDHDNDLVRVNGRADAAVGEFTHLSGRVLDVSGRPLTQQRVEIWQCDARGIYHHPGDGRGAARDPGFQGYGQTLTDDDGVYHFRTIKPVPYPGRTPHIHMQVARESRRLFATQIYIRGHRGNADDFLFGQLDAQEQRRAWAAFEPWAGTDAMWAARFDLVLPET